MLIVFLEQANYTCVLTYLFFFLWVRGLKCVEIFLYVKTNFNSPLILLNETCYFNILNNIMDQSIE